MIDSERREFHPSGITEGTPGEKALPVATAAVRQEGLRIPRRVFCGIVAGAFAGLLADENIGQSAETAAPRATAKGDGALVICGGGKLPPEVHARFLELAGGKGARIVVIPTASVSDEDPLEGDVGAYWKGDRGAASFDILHTENRDRANDPEFVKMLQGATGGWFSGGNQSTLIDAYSGTLVEKELQKLLARGGVIGGTSAGAAVMSKVMIKGGKTEAKVGTGFGFLPEEVIVDQHCKTRGRLGRLLGVLKKNPECVGIGIDENTAIIVQAGVATVIGKVIQVCEPTSKDGEHDVRELKDGDQLDVRALVAAVSRGKLR